MAFGTELSMGRTREKLTGHEHGAHLPNYTQMCTNMSHTYLTQLRSHECEINSVFLISRYCLNYKGAHGGRATTHISGFHHQMAQNIC